MLGNAVVCTLAAPPIILTGELVKPAGKDSKDSCTVPLNGLIGKSCASAPMIERNKRTKAVNEKCCKPRGVKKVITGNVTIHNSGDESFFGRLMSRGVYLWPPPPPPPP